jgi:flavin reductase (DIM6/NTAB) family NADH-FMN oxidoreductase RutF
MRNVPHPVVVLTAAAPHPHEDMPLGIAVSSFNTVTLDPPTISFNIRHPSQTLDAIRRDNGRFRIHFLSRKPQSARIAHSFTRGNHQETYQERRRLAEMDTSGKIFSKAAHIKDAHVTAAMQCELTQEMTVGDHIIAVARVSALTAEEPIEPLLMYVQGRYIDGSAQLPHHRRKPDSHK